jgi:Nif-specific regulatory protein
MVPGDSSGVDMAAEGDEIADPRIVQRERDLYLRLLELGHQTDIAPFLKGALELLVEIIGAHQGYLELHDDGDTHKGPRWSIAHALSSDQIDGVRRAISRGIIAEAVATGRTLLTDSAILDPRFKDLKSVREAGIRAVLCSPIGNDHPRGVLYLTGRTSEKTFSEDDLARAEVVTRHLAPFVDRLLLQQRRADADDPTRPLRAQLRLDGVIGRSKAMAAVLREVAVAAPSSKTVLLTGQTGTGKTHIARVIHENSPRARRPFVEVSCTNLDQSLVGAQLFGYKRGAFTGAERDTPGLVAAAEHGTLFLDEIGDMKLEEQGKLLQLLQSKQYYPLQSTTPIRADIRVIAGTHVDLERAVAERKFREDLLCRLDVFTIRLPALEERREDIRELAAFLCAEACRSEGHAPRELSRDALCALEVAKWPRNVRKLEHTIVAGVERAVREGVMQVERRHVFPDTAVELTEVARSVTYQDAMRDFQGRFVREALVATDWNVSETARRLDMSKGYLYDLIKAHGIQLARG